VVARKLACRVTKEKGNKEGEPKGNPAGEVKVEQTEYERE